MIRALVVASLMISPVGGRSHKTMNHPFIVKNFGEHTIVNVFISAVDRESWETDLLPGAIEPGYQHTFNLTEGCEQDVKIVYANGHWTVDRDVDTCENDLATHY
jgi:hypothetical protein